MRLFRGSRSGYRGASEKERDNLTLCITKPIDGPIISSYASRMKLQFTYWEEENWLIGFLNDYPDYWTQGEDLDDLKAHLRDLYKELSSGQIPGIRKVGELDVA